MEIKKLVNEIHNINKEKGFWDDERNTGELLMLIVSEVAEALEAHRKKHSRLSDIKNYDFSIEEEKTEYEKIYKDCFESEIADTIIRLLDLCGGLNIDIEWFIKNKIEYNKTRGYKHNKAY